MERVQLPAVACHEALLDAGGHPWRRRAGGDGDWEAQLRGRCLAHGGGRSHRVVSGFASVHMHAYAQVAARRAGRRVRPVLLRPSRRSRRHAGRAVVAGRVLGFARRVSERRWAREHPNFLCTLEGPPNIRHLVYLHNCRSPDPPHSATSRTARTSALDVALLSRVSAPGGSSAPAPTACAFMWTSGELCGAP